MRILFGHILHGGVGKHVTGFRMPGFLLARVVVYLDEVPTASSIAVSSRCSYIHPPTMYAAVLTHAGARFNSSVRLCSNKLITAARKYSSGSHMATMGTCVH